MSTTYSRLDTVSSPTLGQQFFNFKDLYHPLSRPLFVLPPYDGIHFALHVCGRY